MGFFRDFFSGSGSRPSAMSETRHDVDSGEAPDSKRRSGRDPSSISRIASLADWQDVLDHSRTSAALIYKHSAICGSSLFARQEVENLSQEFDGPIFELVVQDARSVSNEIAKHLGVRHETPQVIGIKDGTVLFHASHGRVRSDAILSLLAETAA